MKLIVILFLVGCSLTPKIKYDASDKMLIGFNVALQTLDVNSTIAGLKNGAIEANPVYGKHPTTERIIITKAISASLIYFISNEMKGDERKLFFIITGLLYSFVVINNYRSYR